MSKGLLAEVKFTKKYGALLTFIVPELTADDINKLARRMIVSGTQPFELTHEGINR